MAYLITQIWFCLLLAFLLGCVLGYLICKGWCCGAKSCDLNSKNCDAEKAMGTCIVKSTVIDLDTAVDLDTDGYGIETLQGIGPQTGDLFRGIGISSVGDYLRNLYQPSQREKVAEDLKIKIKPLHAWASMSDLLRIGGVDHQFAELLHASGILTVAELAGSDARTLTTKMTQVNSAGRQLIAPTVPTEDQVAAWVDAAKGMKAVVVV